MNGSVQSLQTAMSELLAPFAQVAFRGIAGAKGNCAWVMTVTATKVVMTMTRITKEVAYDERDKGIRVVNDSSGFK